MAADELRLESRGIDGSTSSVGGGSPNAWREIILIFGLFFLFAGSPPPDVNEAHYLAKAKHYWDSSWCGPDLFLDSADAHPVFYWLFGWMTLCCSLTTVTWLGRVVTWTLLAVGWQRLSWSVVPQRYASVATATMFVVLCDRCHLAGEWAVGGLEAKGLAYALVLFGLRAIVLERWQAVWMWMGAATAVHVLVGGWSLLAGGICWWFSGNRRPPLGTMRGGLALGACCALVGLVPAIRLMLGADPDMAQGGERHLRLWTVSPSPGVSPFRAGADHLVRCLAARLGGTLVVRPRPGQLATSASVCRSGVVVFRSGDGDRHKLSDASTAGCTTAEVLLVPARRHCRPDGRGAGNCRGGAQASPGERPGGAGVVGCIAVVLRFVYRLAICEPADRFSARGRQPVAAGQRVRGAEARWSATVLGATSVPGSRKKPIRRVVFSRHVTSKRSNGTPVARKSSAGKTYPRTRLGLCSGGMCCRRSIHRQ